MSNLNEQIRVAQLAPRYAVLSRESRAVIGGTYADPSDAAYYAVKALGSDHREIELTEDPDAAVGHIELVWGDEDGECSRTVADVCEVTT
jgi:hypothetical protein